MTTHLKLSRLLNHENLQQHMERVDRFCRVTRDINARKKQQKIDKLKHRATSHQPFKPPPFYPRVKNLSDTPFNEDETDFLNKGYTVYAAFLVRWNGIF